MGELERKVCVITGAAGSLGLASARLFLEAGARVLLVDRDTSRLTGAAGALGAFGDRVDAVEADVADAAQTRRYLEHAVAKWGKLDVLFSNAGISGTTRPVTDFPEDVFDAVMAVNVRASFLACKYGLPQMNDGGSIIITSSIMGVTASPNAVAYVTSKHALVGLMRTVAKEVAPRNIRVNILAPGPIDNDFQAAIEARISEAIGRDATQMINERIPLRRHARPEEVAQTALFLASDRSSFCTGSVYMADGGMNA